jgi:hypothetical protein
LTIVYPEAGKPDAGTYRINFQSPKLERKLSDELKANMSGDAIRDRMKGYFNSVGVNTIVTKKTFNAKDEETDTAEEIIKAVYDIKLDRLVAAPSTAAMSIMIGSTKATITLEKDVQVSDPPMTGQF